MIFIATDILNPYKREILSQDSYNTLIDFLVEQFPDGFKRPTDISVNGHEVALADYDIELKEEDIIVLLDRAALPVGLIGGWFITALANLAISVTLSYVANKLFAPDAHEAPQQTSSVYNLNSAQNIARYGSPIPIVYGKVRMFPSMIVQPYYKFEDNVEYLYHVLCIGHGTCTTDEVLIGDDAITNTGDFDWKLLYKDSFYNIPYNAYGVHLTKTLSVPSTMELKGGGDESEKYTISADASKVEFDYMYPRGLFYVKGDGEYTSTSSSFTFRIYTLSGSTYTSVYSETIWESGLTVDAIQKTYTRDISAYNEPVYVSFQRDYYYDHPRDTHDLYIKRVKEIHPNEDFTQRYGDITLLACKIKATDTVSSAGQVKVNGYFTRTDVGNTMSEVLTDIYTNTNYGGGLSSDDLSFPVTTETVNCAYDSSMTIFDAMRRPALAQGYSLYLAGMDVILKKDAPTTITSAMYNEMNILRNSFKAQYLFKEEFPAYDGFKCSYIDGDGWIQKSVTYPSTSSRPQVVDLFGVVDWGVKPPTGENLLEIDLLSTPTPFGVAISGSVAYVVSSGGDAIVSIDISDPANLVQLDSYTSVSLNNASNIAISGNVAYVVSTTADSITSIDISNPSALAELDSYTSANLNYAYDIAISGSVAYVSTPSTKSIVSIDISNPSSMSELGSFASVNTTATYGITVSGTVAYLAVYGDDAITAIDISTPASMSELGSFTSSNLNGAKNVTVVGNVAYVTAYLSDSLVTIDITDPTSMSQLGVYSNANINAPERVIVNNGVAYVTSGDVSYLVTSLDVSDPTNITLIDTLTGSANYASRGIAISGDYAYVASGGSNLFYTVSIADPIQDFTIADSMAKYLYKQEESRRKIVSFSTDIQGLVPQFLDKIMVSHSSLQWGEAGEVYSRSGDNLIISDALEDLTGSKTIVFRDIDGSVSDPYTITITDDTHITVTGMPAWVTTNTFYTVQEAGTAKEFLVIAVKPSGDTVQIDCVNYDETIYE